MLSGHAAAPSILVVDDDLLMRSMATHSLTQSGFQVTVVSHGEQALELFQHQDFALVLLDVVMPGLDGYQVCTRLRALPRGESLPILMLTGLNDGAAVDQAFQAGATDFIAKPFHWPLLAQRVRYCLRASATAEAATRSRQQLERAQHMAQMGSWEIFGATPVLRCSPELATILCAPSGGARLSPQAFLQRVHADDRSGVMAARQAALDQGTAYQLMFRLERFDGAMRSMFEQATPVEDVRGGAWVVEGITQDVTARVEAERQASHLAHHDGLTGLPNRSFFHDMAAAALERAQRLNSVCALLHVDIDQFKSVNDAFGHADGDRVLRLLAERLQASLRGGDMATLGAESRVARVGANAFTLLLVGLGGERQAQQVADRLMRALALPLTVRDSSLTLTASVGTALYPRDASEPRALARCAEQVAYQAKAAGRHQQRFFDAVVNAQASLRLTRESELRQGIAAGQWRQHYQPKVDARSGRIVGAEALVRWQHPQRGLVMPGEFIALAEGCGLVLPLTDWVLEQACTDVARRAAQGLPSLPVAVNLASPSFNDEALHDKLLSLLGRHALTPSALTLEVTESLLMRDVPGAVRRLAKLRAQGFRLSLDDFGTGYSSLGYLRQFAVDELKIDRSFITDASQGAREGAIARAIIALGREFGLQVVAEGVETAAQAHFLLQQACPIQQGYLFARPLSQADFDRLLATGARVTVPAAPGCNSHTQATALADPAVGASGR